MTKLSYCSGELAPRKLESDDLDRLTDVELTNALGDVQFDLDDFETLSTERYNQLVEEKNLLEISVAKRGGVALEPSPSNVYDLQSQLPGVEITEDEDSVERRLSSEELERLGQSALFGDEVMKQSA